MELAESKVLLQWVAGTLMVGMDSRGRPVVIGSRKDEKADWVGTKPSDLLLLAAASCSTYDVVTILAKQREDFRSVEVSCVGQQNTEPPHAFVSIHLHYVLQGNVNVEKLEKAIQLSEEKYCSVLATLKPTVHISSDYEILP